jgi:iron complex outermembrane receptor protein
LRYDNLWYLSEDFITPALDAQKRFTRLTPKLSVSLFSGAHTVFAALGGGVEAPAFNEIDPPPPFDVTTSFNPFLEAMHSRAYELGARGSLTNGLGTWRYDAALYQIDTDNDIVPFAGGAYFFTAGKSRRQGFEAGLNWRVSDRLALRGTGNLSKNEYVDFVNDLGDFAGKDMPGLPKASWTAGARVTMPQGLGLDVSTEGMGQVHANDANTAGTFGYGLVHASIDYTTHVNGLQLRAFVSGHNLLDKEHIASVFINPISDTPGGPLRYLEPGLPRSWNLGLTVAH